MTACVGYSRGSDGQREWTGRKRPFLCSHTELQQKENHLIPAGMGDCRRNRVGKCSARASIQSSSWVLGIGDQLGLRWFRDRVAVRALEAAAVSEVHAAFALSGMGRIASPAAG